MSGGLCDTHVHKGLAVSDKLLTVAVSINIYVTHMKRVSMLCMSLGLQFQ